MSDPSLLDARFAAVTDHFVGLGGDPYAYPDEDNHLEDMVFTFEKRSAEARVYAELLGLAYGTERPVAGLALDAGCGLGAHAARLEARFTHPCFVDADARRLRRAAAQPDGGRDPRFFVADLTSPTWASAAAEGAFTFIQCVQVLGHVPLAAVQPALSAFATALAPGGHLLLGVPFVGSPMDDFWITFLDGDAPRPMPTDARKYDRLARAPQAMRLPVRHFALGTLLEGHQQAGLEVVQHKPYNWFSDERGDLFVLAKKPG
jgi:SAM-dependent methyltransferase